MKLLDSRRLTGPGLLQDVPGAVLEVALAEADAAAAIALWQEEAHHLLAAVGWGGERLAVRRYPGGASLALSAPFDALYAATEVAESAWSAAVARFEGAPPPSLEERAARLRALIAAERRPALRLLAAEAARYDVAFLWDDEEATVGMGTGSLTWPVAALPEIADIPWHEVHDIPALLVTGTNGKTTTVRLLAAMAAAAGRVAGVTSTDRVVVGAEELDRGDYSGPGGARLLLRDRRVELAILETARGGILRRGLALTRATAAAVTNIAADHLGEFGILDVPALAEAKLVVTRVVGPGGRVVLNADDPELAARGREPGRFRAPVLWFAMDPALGPQQAGLRAHLAAGGEAALLEDGILALHRRGERHEVAPVQDIPVAFGGAARYNVANALAAIGLAAAADLPVAAMAAGLTHFVPTPEENPGRANLLERDGVHLLLDYAHNPHGLAALLELARSLPAARRLILLGQAGDRDDESLCELARAAWSFRPDRVIVKELGSMLRGRAPGEVPAILEAELRRLGAPADALAHADSDPDAVRQALAWARPGDLLVLLVHSERETVLELLGA